MLAVAIPLVAAALLTADPVMAASRRGPEVPVATFKVSVDLDSASVAVRSAGGKLPGVGFDVELVADDSGTNLATLAVSVRNDSDRTLLHDIQAELRSGPKELDPYGAWVLESEQLRVGTVSGTAQWSLYHGALRSWTMKVRLFAGVPLAPGERAVVRGPDGIRVVVPKDAIPYEAFVAVESAPDPGADAGDMQWIGGVALTLEPTSVHSAMPPPDLPLALRLRSKQDPSSLDEFVVGHLASAEVVTDDEQQQGADRVPHWLPLAHAVLKGSNLVSTADLLAGVMHAGTWGFFRVVPRLYVRGTVRDASGPRAGAIVKASHSPVIATTNAAGRFVLAVPSVASVVLTALDPLRGQRGTAAGGVVGGARTLDLDVSLAPMSGEIVTRDGIRNGGFERDDVSGWVATSTVEARTSPLACTGGTLLPAEGSSMAVLTTVAPDVPASSLSQPFDVPAGVHTLTFDYDVVSSEFTAGAPAPDAFVATIVTPAGDFEIVRVTTEDPSGTSVVGDCGDGENYAETGWRSASIDLSAFGGEPAARVRLVLSVVSALDASLPTRVLVDNFRFATLWVAPKHVTGVAGDEARAVAMTEGATEILRQAGVNVRSRPLETLADPGGTLATLDIAISGSGACGADLTRQDIDLTAEMAALLVSGRSPTGSDLNAWWVAGFSGQAGTGYAIGPDDFCSAVTVGTNDGIVLADAAGPNALAHEAGHMLLSPTSAASPIEHRSVSGNFMISNSPALGVVSREQSRNINRIGASYLVP